MWRYALFLVMAAGTILVLLCVGWLTFELFVAVRGIWRSWRASRRLRRFDM